MNRVISELAGRADAKKADVIFKIAAPSQLGVLPPQALQLSGLLSRGPGPCAGINLGLAHPLAHRLRAADPK